MGNFQIKNIRYIIHVKYKEKLGTEPNPERPKLKAIPPPIQNPNHSVHPQSHLLQLLLYKYIFFAPKTPQNGRERSSRYRY